MKTKRANSVLRILMTSAAALAISCPAWSGGDVKIVPLSEGSKAAISFVGTQANEARITIESDDQSVQYYSAKIMNADDYKKLFDFSHLDDGTYNLVAQIDGETIRKSFTKEGDKVFTEDIMDKSTQLYAPMFRKLDNTLVCYFQNPDASDVNVQFAEGSESFFKDSDESGEIFFKRYDLSKLPSGTYQVALSAGSHFYTYELEIK